MCRGKDWYRSKRRQLIEQFGGRCSRDGCRSRSRLELAHVKPTPLRGRGRGFNDRVLDVLRHPDAYVLLCRRHHLEFDRRRGQPGIEGEP